MKTKPILTICISAFFAVLLYLFASSFRYQAIQSRNASHYYDDGEMNYATMLYYDYEPPVFLDTWRGRLCYFDKNGKRHYAIPKQKEKGK